jgi:hypothetical protein
MSSPDGLMRLSRIFIPIPTYQHRNCNLIRNQNCWAIIGCRASKGRLANAKSLVVMVSYMVDRLGLTGKCLTVIEKLEDWTSIT